MFKWVSVNPSTLTLVIFSTFAFQYLKISNTFYGEEADDCGVAG